MKTKIGCYFHNTNTPLWGTEVLEYLIQYIYDHQMLDILDFIYINNIGKEIDTKMFSHLSDKIIICNDSPDLNKYECITLRKLHAFSKENPDYKIFYLHSKGVSYDKSLTHKNACIKQWIQMMLYCLVDHSKQCIELLDYYDTIGINYCDHFFITYMYDTELNYYSPPHYSGNFWWANTNYIQNLDVEILQRKYDAEFWLLSSQPKFLNCYSYYEQSLDLYHSIVDKNKYESDISRYIDNYMTLCKTTIYNLGYNYNLINQMIQPQAKHRAHKVSPSSCGRTNHDLAEFKRDTMFPNGDSNDIKDKTIYQSEINTFMIKPIYQKHYHIN